MIYIYIWHVPFGIWCNDMRPMPGTMDRGKPSSTHLHGPWPSKDQLEVATQGHLKATYIMLWFCQRTDVIQWSMLMDCSWAFDSAFLQVFASCKFEWRESTSTAVIPNMPWYVRFWVAIQWILSWCITDSCSHACYELTESDFTQ